MPNKTYIEQAVSQADIDSLMEYATEEGKDGDAQTLTHKPGNKNQVSLDLSDFCIVFFVPEAKA